MTSMVSGGIHHFESRNGLARFLSALTRSSERRIRRQASTTLDRAEAVGRTKAMLSPQH